MGKDPTSLPEDRSEWPTFLSGGRLPKVGDPDDEDVHSAPGPGALPVSGYGLAHYPGAGARTTKTYALQPISSSVPNPSGAGPRMHDYSIRVGGGGVGAQAVQVAPGLMGVRTPVMAPATVTTLGAGGADAHAIIGGSSVPASASMPVSVVSRSVSGASSSRRSDSKSTTSSGSASEDVDIDIDIDIDIDGDEEDLDSTHHGASGHRLRRRHRRGEERDIEVDVESMEEGDVDEEEGRGVVSVRPMSSRVRWEKEEKDLVLQQQRQRRDAFQVNSGVYGGSAPGYGYAPSSYSSTGSVGYSPGYGVGSYGARRGAGGGVAMKREEDEMSVSFSVREEDEEEEEEAEAEDEAGGTKSGWSNERRWDGMEMEVDMDMD